MTEKKEKFEDDYDPHEHRDVENPTTTIETFAHILKYVLGSGVLAMPYAFKNSGYVVGLIGTIFIGVLSPYCILVLIRSQYILCKRHRLAFLAYSESMKLALSEGPGCLKFLSNASVYIVDGVFILLQIGLCCIFIVFVAKNVKQFCDSYVGYLDERLHICILFVPFLLLTWIRNLKRLTPLSTFANAVMFVGLGICLYYIFQALPPLNERKMMASLETFPLFLGTVVFSIAPVGTVVLESKMKNPKAFGGWCGILNLAIFITVVINVILGFFGYWKYGEDLFGSITLNLPLDDPLAQSVRIIFAIAMFFSYAIQAYVPVDIVWNQHLRAKCEAAGSNKLLLYEYLIRSGIVVITTLLAILIPRLALFISLFGALCFATLGIVFPAILELCVHWPDDLGPYKWILIKDILIGIFGFLAMICGSYTSIRNIIISFRD